MSAYMEFTDDPENRRICPTCGLTSDGSDCFGGPDPCLGLILGVHAACCGHGVLRLTGVSPRDTCYASLDSGQTLYGDAARDYFASVGRPVPGISA